MSKSPAYFDLQVNGCFGVDFNQDHLDADQLHHACEQLAGIGVAGILATFVTEQIDAMALRLAHLATLRAQDPLAHQIIRGIHVEGPFINETVGYRGAHPEDAVRPASTEAMKKLLDAGQGLVKLVTLAPERDAGSAVTRLLARQGVVVSAGHCNPSLDELRAAIDAGVTMFTHVGNGCPMQVHRHDNIVQRVLSLSDRLWCCFIADGAHVPFFALKNYLRVAGIERSIVVTDAIAPAGMGPGRYRLSRWDLVIGDDLVARAPDGSHLVGAVLTMPQAYRNLVERVGLTEREAEMLTVGNPRRAIE